MNDTFNITLANDSIGRAIQPRAPMYVVVTASMFYVVIFLIGVFGNVLVIVVISLSRQKKTAIDVYLINLCIADLLVLLLCMPTALAEIYTMEEWHFGSLMCKLVPFFENTVANASVLTILAISIERYRVVCQPVKGIEEDFTKVARIVAVIWIMSGLTSAPCLSIAVFRPSRLMNGTPIMVCRNPIVKSWQRAYIVLLAVLFFLVPFSVMFILYCRLCCILRRSRAKYSKTQDAIGYEHYTDQKRLQNQVINIITSIVVLFFLCHLPLRVVGLWFTFEDKQIIFSLGLEKYLNILFSTRILFYINHALNPIIYNVVSVKFRSSLRLMLLRNIKCACCGKVRKKKRPYVFMSKFRRSQNDPRNNEHRKNSSQKCNSLVPPPIQTDNNASPSALAEVEEKNEILPHNSSITAKDLNVHIKVDEQLFAITFHLGKCKWQRRS